MESGFRGVQLGVVPARSIKRSISKLSSLLSFSIKPSIVNSQEHCELNSEESVCEGLILFSGIESYSNISK